MKLQASHHILPSESLPEFESDEIDFEQYWYYAVKAE